MARRVGIELSPSRCAIVDLDVSRGHDGQVRTRIRAFRAIPCSADNPASLVAALRHLRATRSVGKRASVALAGMRQAQQTFALTSTGDDDVEAMAVREARKSMPLVGDAGAVSGVLLDEPRLRTTAGKRDVTVVAASGSDVESRLAPLVAAGFIVERATTAASALGSLARLLQRQQPGEAEAYVAVNAEATTVAIVRNGLLVFAREVPLAITEQMTDWLPAQPPDFAARLASELKRSFLFYKQQSRQDVRRVFVCGEFPNLRAFTAPLMNALDVDVETLDVAGIAAEDGRGGLDVETRDRIGEMRVAWAVAADLSQTLDLQPPEAAAQRDARSLVWRTAAAVLIPVVVFAACYAVMSRIGGGRAQRIEQLRQESSRLEGVLSDRDRAREAGAHARAAAAMLQAARTQGPRLARVLEVIGQSAPPAVVLEELQLRSNGASWPLTVTGKAAAPTAASAQSAFNGWLHLVSAFPPIGTPVTPPLLRISAQTSARDGEGGATTAAVRTNSVSRLDFAVGFEVRK